MEEHPPQTPEETEIIISEVLRQEERHEHLLNPQHNKLKNIILLTVFLAFGLGIIGGILGSLILRAPQISNALSSAYPKQLEPVTITDEESAIIDVADHAKPAVVSVLAKKQITRPGFLSPDGQPYTTEETVGGGTGFIVKGDGTIITNKHVVSDDTANYEVLTNDGSTYNATILAKDPINDIAIIKIDGDNPFPTLPLGESDSLKVGQTVIAIGNALGRFPNSVSVGVVSGIGRSITAADQQLGQQEQLSNIIQTDAAINQGNSGGPLLDIRGNVIALNTAIAANGQSIGFAIASNDVRKDLNQVETTGRIQVPYLGIRYVMLDEQIAKQHNVGATSGALIANGSTQQAVAVLPGSPAEKVGLKAGDVITKIDDKDLNPDFTLSQALKQAQVGQEIHLVVQRGSETLNIDVTLEERPEQQ